MLQVEILGNSGIIWNVAKKIVIELNRIKPTQEPQIKESSYNLGRRKNDYRELQRLLSYKRSDKDLDLLSKIV